MEVVVSRFSTKTGPSLGSVDISQAVLETPNCTNWTLQRAVAGYRQHDQASNTHCIAAFMMCFTKHQFNQEAKNTQCCTSLKTEGEKTVFSVDDKMKISGNILRCKTLRFSDDTCLSDTNVRV